MHYWSAIHYLRSPGHVVENKGCAGIRRSFLSKENKSREEEDDTCGGLLVVQHG